MIIVGIAAFVGAILYLLRGWLDSGEPFNWRKSVKSIIVALIAAIGFGITYSYASTITLKDIYLALVSGFALDGLRDGGSDVVRKLIPGK